MDQAVVSAFHDAYYNAMPDTWENVFFLGVPVRKNPMDLWTYQEIIYDRQPDFLIECGTAYGGSALFFAHVMDMVQNGQVITLDIMADHHFEGRPQHSRITYATADTSRPTAVARVEGIMQMLEGGLSRAERKVMVVLDSEHTQVHVRAELEIWPHLVTPGQYLVVEDTNITPQLAPQYPDGGPKEALADWHRFYPEFVVDPLCEKHGLTFNPGGWLLRK